MISRLIYMVFCQVIRKASNNILQVLIYLCYFFALQKYLICIFQPHKKIVDYVSKNNESTRAGMKVFLYLWIDKIIIIIGERNSSHHLFTWKHSKTLHFMYCLISAIWQKKQKKFSSFEILFWIFHYQRDFELRINSNIKK